MRIPQNGLMPEAVWLVTFMSVVPAGLILAHFQRISLMKVEKESIEEEEKALGG